MPADGNGTATMSHPSRVRGLKLYVGDLQSPSQVAPLAGAWIETHPGEGVFVLRKSHPSRVRGLKHILTNEGVNAEGVAPLAGAWIETPPVLCHSQVRMGRTPRGCVD